MKLTDTHCHLYFNKFDDDRDEVITRAKEAGVEKILVPGITRETSHNAVKLANAHPEVFAAVGIHPINGIKKAIAAGPHGSGGTKPST